MYALQNLVWSLPALREELGADKCEALRARLLGTVDSAVGQAIKDKEAIAAARAKREKAADPDESADSPEARARAGAAMADSMKLQLIDRLKELRAALDSPATKGELVGHAAPALTFDWSSSEKPIKSLADLKGKVVLLDFWATWCTPCVGAFPKMRELQTRYTDFPVVILGVTSAQGYHMDRKNKKRINTPGDPGREHELMRDFIRDMDMTWPVVFSGKPVFNADFGVRGIPHVAIIDSTGRVRFNALHPDAKDAADKIDQLLREASLAAPSTPFTPPATTESKPKPIEESKP